MQYPWWFIPLIGLGIVVIGLANVIIIKKLLKKSPVHATEAAFNALRATLRERPIERHLAVLEDLVKRGTSQPEVFLTLGLLYTRLKRYPQAAELLRTVVIRKDVKGQTLIDAIAGYLEALVNAGRLEIATAEALRFSKSHRSAPEILRAALQCFIHARRWQDAEVLPRRIEKLEGVPAPELWTAYYLNHALWSFDEQHEHKAALASLKSLARKLPGNPAPLLEMARIYTALGDSGKAADVLSTATNCTTMEQHQLFENLTKELTHGEIGIRLIEQLVEASTKAADRVWLKTLLLELFTATDQYDRARETLHQESWPTFIPAHLMLRLVHVANQLGELDFVMTMTREPETPVE